MNIKSEIDALTIDDLVRRGSAKWTRFPGTIGAFVAEMDYGTAPAVSLALSHAVDTYQFGYLSTPTSDALSQATSAWLAQNNGWNVPQEWVRPLPDVLKGLEAAIELYTDANAPVILPTPAYMPFFKVPKLSDREIIEVPMLETDGFYEFDFEGIEQALAGRKGLFILCNPYNPLGRVFTRDELVKLSEVIERTEARVFSDEIHSPLVFGEHTHISYASLSNATAKHTITTVSASKAWNLPGLKCAQVVLSNEADASVWDEHGQPFSKGASTLGVIANTAAYTSGMQWLDEIREYTANNFELMRDLLAEHLPDARYRAPEGTYIAWIDWNAYDLSPDPATFFRENAGVSLTNGADCGAPGVGYTRMILATPAPILKQAVLQMAAAINSR
ncbi:MAG: MalY/PatB family protein [Leucobacter sp.]